MKKLPKLIRSWLFFFILGLCFYLGFMTMANISDSLFYKIVLFIWLVWLLIYLPFKYYFTDSHEYSQEDELNAETKEIREYIKLRGGR
jgi:fatty acid desaturase